MSITKNNRRTLEIRTNIHNLNSSDDEEENQTGLISQRGFVELINPIATNLRYEEGKYGRMEGGDTGGSSNKTLHKR